MRAGRLVGLVLVAPAAIAAATLAVFLAAGLLIVIAGPAATHRPAARRPPHPAVPSPRPGAGWSAPGAPGGRR